MTAFAQGSQKSQPLPEPLGQPPYHLDLESILPGIEKQSEQLGKLVFHTVGDTGGVKNPDDQSTVAATMKGDLLTHEFAAAPKEKAPILALHHPVYSFDDHHSGTPRMADAVQHAVNDSRRVPNAILTAHVRSY